MARTKKTVIRDEISSLCKARMQALQDLEKHLSRNDGSEILADIYEKEIKGLEKRIAEKAEIFFAESKP